MATKKNSKASAKLEAEIQKAIVPALALCTKLSKKYAAEAKAAGKKAGALHAQLTKLIAKAGDRVTFGFADEDPRYLVEQRKEAWQDIERMYQDLSDYLESSPNKGVFPSFASIFEDVEYMALDALAAIDVEEAKIKKEQAKASSKARKG
jgi:plastocyanin